MRRRLVVGAVILDDLHDPTRVLACRRRVPAGRWEFPGGKVEPGETATVALQRELAEELGVRVQVGDEMAGPVDGAWPLTDTLELRLWRCTLMGPGPEEARDHADHDEVRWVALGDLRRLDWLDGDRPAVERLVDGVAGG